MFMVWSKWSKQNKSGVMICQTGGTQTQDSETGQVNSTQEMFISLLRPAKLIQGKVSKSEELSVGSGRRCRWSAELLGCDCRLDKLPECDCRLDKLPGCDCRLDKLPGCDCRLDKLPGCDCRLDKLPGCDCRLDKLPGCDCRLDKLPGCDCRLDKLPGCDCRLDESTTNGLIQNERLIQNTTSVTR